MRTRKSRCGDYDDLKSMVDWEAVKRYRASALHPAHPHSMGSAEQPETYFQHREASNGVYNETPAIIEKYMNMVNEKLGTDYKLFNYYGAPDATEILVAMGSVCDAAEEVVDLLTAEGKRLVSSRFTYTDLSQLSTFLQ